MGDIDVESILSRFPPCLRKNLKEIWECPKIGLSEMDMNIIPLPNQRINQDYERVLHSNRFVLKIPFASKQLEWEIIFNEEDLEFPPDFNFHDDYFLADPSVDEILSNVPSLTTWNLENSKSLLLVAQELIVYYKKHQIERLQNEAALANIYEEYNYLISKGIFENSVEVFVDSNFGVVFLILLTIDVSSVLKYWNPSVEKSDDQNTLSSGEETATLRVYFPKPEGGRITTHFLPSPWLQRMIKGPPKLQFPAYNKDLNLGDYVENVINALTGRIKSIENHHKLKNEYITHLVSLRGLSMVEYDNIKFTKATFLCEVEDFYCLVCVTLSDKFPAEKPIVTLRSVTKLNGNKLFTQQLEGYPYSPRWKVEEMIQRLLSELLTAVPKFKEECDELPDP